MINVSSKRQDWVPCALEEQPKTNNDEKQRISIQHGHIKEKTEVQWPPPKSVLMLET